jgi:polar amino acid transport system substrate-binding protein
MTTRNAALLALSISALATSSVVNAQEISITPERLKWMQSVASPSETALLLGGPGQPGPSVVRARLKPGMKVMPHSHPVDVHVTVLSGTLLYGQGESFDEAKLKEYPAGSFFVERANLPHYQMPKGSEGVVFQASLIGANAFNYVNPQDDPRNARAELAPSGKLRVGLILNPAFVTKDGSAAEMRGVAVDLGRELAQRLRVDFEPVRYNSAAKIWEGARAGEWDIAFLGFDAARTADMDFTAGYLEIGTTYLVPAGSKIRTLSDADQPGHRIAVSERSVQDIYLSRNLKRAELMRVSSMRSEAVALLNSGKVQAISGNRALLLDLAAQLSGSRILDENFAVTRHALAVAKGRPAGMAYAREFIEQAKAGGLVRQAIERAELRGVNVAPRAPAP